MRTDEIVSVCGIDAEFGDDCDVIAPGRPVAPEVRPAPAVPVDPVVPVVPPTPGVPALVEPVVPVVPVDDVPVDGLPDIGMCAASLNVPVIATL
ncbi:MAG: hypothetical protein U0Q11_22225 [Vicinamibacterales bacterium]